MRHDIEKDDEDEFDDFVLDDEVVKRIQAQLKSDPKKRIVEIGSILRFLLGLLVTGALIAVLYYYGTIMYQSYQFGEKHKSKYDNIIKESE